MFLPVDFRPALATALLLVTLAGAYEVAARFLVTSPLPVAPVRFPMATDSTMQGVTTTTTYSTDTVALSGAPATPLPVLPPAPAPALPPCPAEPLRFVPPVDPAQRWPLQLHRYVGTVGGQPATVLLQWRTPDKVSGRFYVHRGRATYWLEPGGWHGGRAVLTILGQGEWHLAGPPGAALRGTWHDSTGTRSLRLRESYIGGVRADVGTLRLVGGAAGREPHSSTGCHVGSYDYDYWQFPGRRPVAPALRRTLGPSPAVRRRRLRTLYRERTNQQGTLAAILLNDFYLLSYQVARFSADIGNEGHGDSWTEGYLFDLATGRELTLDSQLRLGYERTLRRRIQRHLLHDPEFDFINRAHRATWSWQDAAGKASGLVALPEVDRYDDNGHATGLFLTESDLQVYYHSYDLYDVTSGDYWELANQEYSISIPYAELRPLVRPGTPLARLLRARGLW